jgi:ribosomal-protein-serine acetyltransferase
MKQAEHIQVDEAISLELIDDVHANLIYQLVKKDRTHLQEWLPWVEHMLTLADFENFIKGCKKRYNKKSEVAYIIKVQNKVAGRIGLYHIDQSNKIASIGYWVGKEFEGKGVVTKSCKKIVSLGFAKLHLNRIEIKCGTLNYKSQAIPERLNFKKEGIIRQAELLNGKFIDLFLYSLLKEEWRNMIDEQLLTKAQH